MQEEINNYKNIYKSIGSTYCPYLRQEVKFNSPGWNHLLRKRDSMRSTKDVLERAKYLKESSEIISISHTLQEYEERIINKKVNKFYGFIAIIENQKLKIIVRKSGNGLPHFYSLMINYVTSPKRDNRKSAT